MSEATIYWDAVYGTKSDDETSWYQDRPVRSLGLIRAAAPDASAGIIDIGCGTGVLLNELAKAGYNDLTGLDASAGALERARTRLGSSADRVKWLVSDIARLSPSRTWDIWHDRAVFHFLTSGGDQDAFFFRMDPALTTLQWATYFDASDQAGQSRRWGGIHVFADDYDGQSDRLSDVYDYDIAINAIRDSVENGHINLLETLAERIAEACLADPRVLALDVRVEKPAVLPACRSVGIEIHRGRRS